MFLEKEMATVAIIRLSGQDACIEYELAQGSRATLDDTT